MREKISFQIIKIGTACILLMLALIYWADIFDSRNRFDELFVMLVGAAIIVLIIPWERLQSVKAGEFELSLESPRVQDVLDRINLTKEEKESLQKKLQSNLADYNDLQDSRILWIDDNPQRLVGERRLLRALGLEVTTASSSDIAEQLLANDPDYELIITDVQRKGDNYLVNNGVPIHDGTNFIVKLHTNKDPDAQFLDLVRTIPVIFYGAYETARLTEFTKPARDVCLDCDISNDFFDLLEKATWRLKQIRARKSQLDISAIGGTKVPTHPR